MITTSKALPTLERMLAEAGFDSASPDAPLAWRVFKTFAAIPVECAGDALLFQCGTFTLSGAPLFNVDFTRQFVHEVDGEYDHMEQLHCTIYCEPLEELGEVKTNLWSYDFPSLEEFFAAVEALPEFQLPMTVQAVRRAEIWQEQV
jgi:hypothetical protein